MADTYLHRLESHSDQERKRFASGPDKLHSGAQWKQINVKRLLDFQSKTKLILVSVVYHYRKLNSCSDYE